MSSSVTFTIAGQDAEKLKERIREVSKEEGLSMSEWIVMAIADKLRERNSVIEE